MSRRPLSEYVSPPPVNPAALHVEWHEVRRRVRRHRQVRVAALVAASLMVVVSVTALVVRAPRADLLAGQTAVALESARTMTLSDGSEVELLTGGALGLSLAETNEMVLVLERGRASFDVSKRPSRRFVVKADDIDVRVIGTKFMVRREGREVEVEVERGIVEVREGDVVHRLVKGERWVRGVARAEAPAVVEEVQEIQEAELPATDETLQGPESLEPQPQPNLKSPSKRKVVRRAKPPREEEPAGPPADGAAGGSALPPAPVAEAAPVKPPEESPAEPTPADTFAAALRARGAGRAKEAIAGFQKVCERWPSSAFAPMSAFEWGRLALDAQDDPRQAARAFERTLELATSASLTEDALARLAEAYARYDVGSCRRVQSDYLRRFPGGPHVRGVTKACPP
jgi:transmembrane sensor